MGNKREKRRTKRENIDSHAGRNRRGKSGHNSASIMLPSEVRKKQNLCSPVMAVRRDPAIRSDAPVTVGPPLDLLFRGRERSTATAAPGSTRKPEALLFLPAVQEAALRHKRRCRIGDAVILPSVTAWRLCVAGEQCYCGGCSKHCYTPPRDQSTAEWGKSVCKQMVGQPAKEPGALSCPNRNCSAAC